MDQWINHIFGWSILIDWIWQQCGVSLLIRIVNQSHLRHPFQNLPFHTFWTPHKTSVDLIHQLQEWFTPYHLIDNTMVAMVWVTHGFCCSNHERWVIHNWVRHAFFFDQYQPFWPTFAKWYWRYNWHWHESLVAWISPFHRPKRGFRRFIDQTLPN